MKKKKVVIDVERMKYSFTGLHNYCVNLYTNLLKIKQEDFEFNFFAPKFVELLSNVNRIDCSLKDKFLLTKSKDFDLWHITYQNSKYVPINNVKIVFTIHDLNFLYTDKTESKKRKILKKIQKTIDKSAYITVISNYVLNDVKKHLNIQNKPIQVIHNGVDLKKFRNFNTPKIRPKKKFLFTLGTVLYKKNFHVLPKLIEGLDYELVIGGIHPNAEYINFLNSEIKKYHVQNKVILTGALSEEEKYWYIKNCTAFVFPSLSEGFGIPPIEAMLMGKPVFLSTYTSLPEIGGEVAYYFNSFEKESMQKTFIDGMNDFTINNKTESIKSWAKQFNWEKATKQYIDVYRKVFHIEESKIKKINVYTKPITALIITFNEEENIGSLLKNIDFVDEIIVVDSFSTDKTLEIISTFPKVKVLQKKFNNFSEQRNYALEQSQNDWVLFIDADERLSDDLIDEIMFAINNNSNYVAFSLIRDNYIGDKLIKYSGWQNDNVYRVFNKKYAYYNQEKLVHETLMFSGKYKVLKNHLKHYTFLSYEDYKSKLKLYSKLKAEELYKKKVTPNFYHLKIKHLYRYFYHLIIRLGFLDGKNGKLIASINAFGIRNRYLELKKLYEKEKLVNKALSLLRESKVILYPTDTVWGIGCDATNKQAIKKIYQIKKREETKSLIILVNSLEMLAQYVSNVPQEIKDYLSNTKEPTTVIYNNPKNLAENCIAKDNTIAIRVVKNGFVNELITVFKRPIVSTSANLANFKTPLSFNEIDHVIKKKVDFIVPLEKTNKVFKSSKIVKFEEGRIKVVRM